jgi:hypothetical protein
MAATDQRPGLAVNSRGEAVAVWSRYGGATAVVESAAKPAAGSWRSAETITEEAEEMSAPEVGIDAEGGATAIWEQSIEGKLRAAVSARTASGKWAPATAISPLTEGSVNVPRLAEDAAGDAVAVWEHFYPGESQENVEVATRTGPAGAWRKASVLTKLEEPKGEPGPHATAIDAAGDAVAVWSRITESSNEIVEASVSHGGVWQPASVISTGLHKGGEITPEVAVDEAGDAVVVIEQLVGAEERIEAIAGEVTSGGWRKPVTLSAAGQSAHSPQVALDAQGNATALWTRFDGKSAYIAEAAGFDASGPQLGTPSIPTVGAVGQTLSFSAAPLDAWSALGATTWSFGDGTSAGGTTVAHAYTVPGTHTVTLTSSDALGNVSTITATVLIVSPIPASCSVCEAFPAPVISGAHLTHKRFRVGSAKTRAGRRVPQGTTFEVTLSERAELEIFLRRALAGLRSGHSCVAPTAHLRRRHARSCKRLQLIRELRLPNQSAGTDAVAFSGRLPHGPLAAGSYRAELVATRGKLRSQPVGLAFTIVG